MGRPSYIGKSSAGLKIGKCEMAVISVTYVWSFFDNFLVKVSYDYDLAVCVSVMRVGGITIGIDRAG